jgi:dipeptidyl aminopeptidase/acylaminoacyl peptidase
MPEAPYGSWKSPITADLLVASSVGLGALALEGDDLYWLEGRPLEGGRQVLVRRGASGEATDLTPAPFNVRSRVHEYGGGAFAVKDRTAYFVNFADQRIYRQGPGQAPEALTQGDGLRYADMCVDTRRGLLYCVREDHRGPGREPVNTIVAIDLRTGSERVIVEGHDFFAAPRLSPEGGRLCWLSWDHPNMPWDGNELWLAALNDRGQPAEPWLVSGGRDESVFQPEWSPDGALHFVSDRSGWWNLYRWEEGRIRVVLAREAEFGGPQWSFDARSYAFLGDGRILAALTEAGSNLLGLLDPQAGTLEVIDLPLTSFGGPRASGRSAYFVAASPTSSPAVYVLDITTRRLQALKWSTDLRLDPGYISVAQPVEFPTEGGVTAHAFYYPPANKDFVAPEGEKPPLIVMSHGGPTSAASSALSLQKQFWTSRGFAVLDVNYGGSTGYGRAYRERLKGKWGVVDVDDCVNAARYMASRGIVDGGRMAITGGSAGGYTTLCALAFRDVFKAGASHFGVGDLEALARDTHKFESPYLDSLVGPYPGRRDLYLQRSPLHHVDGLNCPVIFFQGLEDRIVPPNQAEAMVDALRRKGVPVAYLAFEGEQHGFRRAENIKRSLEAELYFYGRIFGFEPADSIEPVVIENLK